MDTSIRNIIHNKFIGILVLVIITLSQSLKGQSNEIIETNGTDNSKNNGTKVETPGTSSKPIEPPPSQSPPSSPKPLTKKTTPVKAPKVNAVFDLSLIYANQGDSLLKLNYFIQAESKYKMALKPNSAGTILSRLYAKIGFCEYRLKENDSAVSYCRISFLFDPKCERGYKYLGYIFDDKGYYDSAIACFTKAIEYYYDDTTTTTSLADLYNLRADVKRNAGYFVSAISDYREAISFNKNYGSEYWNCAAAYADKEQYDSAIYFYSEAMRYYKNDSNSLSKLYYWRAYYKYKSNDNDSAITDYLKSITMNHNFGDAYWNCGVSYDKIMNYRSSITMYNLALPYYIKNRDTSSMSIIYDNIGIDNLHLGKYDDAITAFRMAISFDIRYGKAYRLLGETYCQLAEENKKKTKKDIRLKDVELARQYLYTALTFESNIIEISYTSSWIDKCRKIDP
ncbi:MAG: tetratricopeptide repeat protein [Bacteroidia bacterium]